MATIPTPYDATSGTKASAAAFDAGVKDVLNYLLDGVPRAHVYDASGLSMANGVATLVTFDSETYDNDSMHSTASNTSRIVFTTAGRYDVNILLTIGSGTYTNEDLNVRLNSAGSSAGGTSLRTQAYSNGTAGLLTMIFTFKRVFSAADYIELFVNQTSGGAKLLSATSLGTRVFVERLSTT